MFSFINTSSSERRRGGAVASFAGCPEIGAVGVAIAVECAVAAGVCLAAALACAAAQEFIVAGQNMQSLIEAYSNKGTGKVTDDLPTGGKITGYTKHGTEQALGRDEGIGVSNKAITDAVNNPVKPPTPQSGGTIKYIGKDATVVLNQDGIAVTTWANSSSGTR